MKGRCYCGAIHYEITERPTLRGQCHCRECQYISGGAPNMFLLVPDDAFVITRGQPKAFTRNDLETPRTRQFCPDCGTHLTTLLPGRGLTVVKAGTLNDPAGDYGAPEVAIFLKDAQPFHVVPAGVACFDERPPA